MSYADGLIAILDNAESRVTALVDAAGDPRFSVVVRGWKRDLKNADHGGGMYPFCAIVLRQDPLFSQEGARAESRRTTLEFWTINNQGHDVAILLSGAIIDEMESDLTFDGNAQWSRLENVEMYINVLTGFNLHWSKVTFELERRRQR